MAQQRISKYEDFRFEIASDRKLKEILELAFSHHSTADGWKEENGAFVLSWYNKENGGWNAFPGSLTPAEVEPLVISWLKNQDYGYEPDIDGSNRKGFLVYNESYGRINNDPYAFVAIKPEWISYHK